MNARYLAALAATASTLTIAHTLPVSAQIAAQASASSSTGLEEVIVTARRKEEKAQTVPITITSFTQAALDQQEIHAPNDLNKVVPAIQLCCNRGAVSFAWIRGIPGVIGYFNQLPTIAGAANPSGLNGSAFYFDLGSLQVLKGPQGTLFGISTNGGAILFESKKPVNDFEGYVQAGGGNYGHTEFEGVINIPIVDDKLLLRAGGQFQTTDGYVHDQRNNRDFYDETYGVGRVSITARPTDEIQNDLVVNYLRSHNHSTAFVWTALRPAPAGVALAIFGRAPYVDANGVTETGILNAFNQQLALGKYAIVGSDASGSTYSNIAQLNVTNTTSWDISDNLTIKNIAGYQQFEVASRTDTDGTPFNILDGFTQVSATARTTNLGANNQLSPFAGQVLPTIQKTPNVSYVEELQLLGKAFNDRLSFTIGTFNQYGALRSPNIPSFTSSAGSVSGAAGIVYYSNRSNAVYAQGTYDLSDYVEGLSFTGGYRYNWDKKEFRQDSYSPTNPNPANFSQHALTSSVGLVGHFHAPTYTLNLSYQFTPTTMFYVTDSKGYTTGGFNINGAAGLQMYQPEMLDNVEIGVKSDWNFMGIKARTNVAAYHGTYDNVQTQLPVVIPGTSTFQVITSNAASAHIDGVETEITIVPTDSLELGAQVAYGHDVYDTYLVATTAGTLNMNNTPFTSNPLFSGNVRLGYHLPIDEAYGDISFHAVLSYQTHQSTTPSLPRLPTYDTPGFENLDLNLDWKNIWGHQGVSGTLYGTNVTGNVRTNGPFQVYSALGLFGIAPKAPPMYGVRLRYEFGGPGEETATAAAYSPPPAVAPAPAVAKNYLIFFDFNKSDLTPQALTIVDQAAHNAGSVHVTKLEVTGHTDTVGSDAYNMRLSRRRAESVAAQLEKDGIPSSEIEIYAKGKRDLLVPTADGVREPQNRRVQIVYSGGPTS
ncbi:MAG: TonB-dependent receptor [Rhodospirillales bacterium]|nr:TonB-dependent receptor [Rhodospirillales bacterium]